MFSGVDDIKIFALTDCHQEARKLGCLFGGILKRISADEKNILICDAGDLFKGIYDRNLCVDAYLQLKKQLPKAEIVVALGNNDFGFNREQLNFLQQTAQRFREAGIHLICANLVDLKTGTCPVWVKPYTILNLNQRKILITAFCVNYINLKKRGLRLNECTRTFKKLIPTIKEICPDAFIILNHNLLSSSHKLYRTARAMNINLDLIVGGHEHMFINNDEKHKIYYPHAFSRNMLYFSLTSKENENHLNLCETIECKNEEVMTSLIPELTKFEADSGMNEPIAESTLNLERHYSEPGPLGTFVADQMKKAINADIAMISTGFMNHALRYEEGKILTKYNVERAFSARIPLQEAVLNADDLKAVFSNALEQYFSSHSSNNRFLQCSQNVSVICIRTIDDNTLIKQIFIDGNPLLNENGKSLNPDITYRCAIDSFIGSGENGFGIMRTATKTNVLKDHQPILIKDLFIKGIKNAEKEYKKGSSYPVFKIIEIRE